MNLNQRFAVSAGALAVLAAVLYVPWVYTFDYETVHSENPAGYHFIFEPPTNHPRGKHTGAGVRVSYSQVAVTAVGAVAVTIAAFFLLSTRKP